MVGFGGAQCTIIALSALFLCHTIETPPHWTRARIDYVLELGDYWYSFVVDSMFGGDYSEDANMLKSCHIDIASNDVSEALHIYPTHKQVQEYNSVR